MNETLTGKRRYTMHTRLFRKPLVVLQVQVTITGKTMENVGSMIEVEDYEHTKWRDARVEDITGDE